MKVLDTSAIINAYPFRHAYTVREVISEIRDLDTKRAAHNLIASGKLIVLEAPEEDIPKIKRAAKETGDRLSRTDCKVLALALGRKGIVVTDDYGIQNVAKKLGIEFVPVQRRGIHRHYIWRHYCHGCKKFRTHYICGVCGTRTKRKVTSKRG